MRIAVSCDTNNGLDSVVAGHFGRCPFFALVDVEDSQVRSFKLVENPFFRQHEPGQVPGLIQGYGADVMLAGGMGRRAVMIFEQAGIAIATGASGTVGQTVDAYLGGVLTGTKPCAESEAHHHGH